MKIAIVSHNYPTIQQPYLQPFIRDHFLVAKKIPGFDPEIFVSEQFSLPFTTRRRQYKSPLLDESSAIRLKYLSIPKRKAPKFTSRRLASELLKKLPKPDEVIVHIHWLYPSGLTIPILKKHGYRTVLMIHGSDWYITKDQSKFQHLIAQSLNAAEKIFVSGDALKKDILKYYPSINIEVMYNYIDTTLFHFSDKGKTIKLKEELGWNKNKIHFFTVANIRYEKGIDILIDAVSRITDRQNVRFHIIGQLADEPYKSSINRKIKKVSEVVEIHEPVSRNQLIKFYQAADAYIMPSRSEGFNVSLLEAVATGLPVIVTDVGNSNLVAKPVNGTVVEPESSEQLAQAIDQLIRKPLKKTPESTRYISDNFSFQNYKERLQKMYRELQFK